MGVYIILTVFVVEIAVTVYCIITKSNRQKLRNIIRCTAFTGFILFTALSVIHWSFRYYALAVLLLLLAIIGAFGLIREKQNKRKYKTAGVVMKAMGITALFFAAALPAVIFPQYVPIQPTGRYQVATEIYTYTDTKRIEPYTGNGENRKLNVELWYPESADGTYPLIVFSHGALGVKTSNETLYNELASHGYIVCSIDHTYQCLFTTDTNGQTVFFSSGFLKELNADDARANKQQSYEYYEKWMKIRTDDINFVIDHILEQAKSSNPDKVYKLADTSKIGVMGHSLGGSAALGIGRTRKDVGAVIALESPFMCDIEGVKNNKFVFMDEKYPIPLLSVYSDSSWSHLADWPQYAENYALLSDDKQGAFNIHISGIGHFSLTDLSLTSPLLTRAFNGRQSTKSTDQCLKIIDKVCLEFFDCYLKGKGEFVSSGTY